MDLTLEWAKSCFEKFNTEIFSKLGTYIIVEDRTIGALPLPDFRLSKAKTYLGQYRLIPYYSDGEMKYLHRLTFSTFHYGLPKSMWEDVMIHEMIHYFQEYYSLKDTAPHGRIFRFIMYLINKTFGRHISISHRSKGTSDCGNVDDHQFENEGRLRIHNILTMKNRDGQLCASFLTKAKAIEWYDLLKREGRYTDFHFYRTIDPIFNDYRHPNNLIVYIFPNIKEMIEKSVDVVEMVRTKRGFEVKDVLS